MVQSYIYFIKIAISVKYDIIYLSWVNRGSLKYICSQGNTKKVFKKTSKLSYTRVKKTPPKKPDRVLYKHKVKILDRYSILEEEGKIDIFYFDESGFSISSNIPYLWSEINNTSRVKTLSNKRINTLGFLSKKSKLKSFITEGKIDSNKVIEVFNEFSKTITIPTVVVLDNASFHKSKKLKSNIARWSNLGLSIFYLPYTLLILILLKLFGGL